MCAIKQTTEARKTPSPRGDGAKDYYFLPGFVWDKALPATDLDLDP